MSDVAPEFSELPDDLEICAVDDMGIRWVRWPEYQHFLAWTQNSSRSDGKDRMHTKRAMWALAGARTAIALAVRIRLYEPNGEQFEPVPENVWLATCMLAHRWYLKPQAPQGVAGGQSTGGVVEITGADQDILALIGPWRAFGVA